MAEKKKVTTGSSKQVNRVEREQRQRQIVVTTAIGIAVLLVLVLGYGILDQTVIQKSKPVAVVNGEKITLQQFEARARYDRFQLIQNISMMTQYAQMFGGDTSPSSYFGQQIQQSVQTLNTPSLLGQQVVQELVNDVVIAQKAKELNITASDEEVERAVQEAFGYYANGTPTTAPTDMPYATATLTDQQLTWVPPAPTVAASTPAAEATVAAPTSEPVSPTTVAQTSVPTQGATEAPTVVPADSATATPFPTATPYTLEGFQNQFAEYAKELQNQANFTPDEFRAIFKSRLLYDKVLAEVTKDLPKEDEYIWARHILVDSPEEAEVILGKLKAGQDFAQLAKDLSKDGSAASGGDLGWFDKSQMVPEFSDAAFALKNFGDYTEKPVKSQYGYHIIQLLGRETRPATSSRLEQLKQTFFNDWLTKVKAEMKITINDNWTDKVPTIPALPSNIAQ